MRFLLNEEKISRSARRLRPARSVRRRRVGRRRGGEPPPPAQPERSRDHAPAVAPALLHGVEHEAHRLVPRALGRERRADGLDPSGAGRKHQVSCAARIPLEANSGTEGRPEPISPSSRPVAGRGHPEVDHRVRLRVGELRTISGISSSSPRNSSEATGSIPSSARERRDLRRPARGRRSRGRTPWPRAGRHGATRSTSYSRLLEVRRAHAHEAALVRRVVALGAGARPPRRPPREARQPVAGRDLEQARVVRDRQRHRGRPVVELAEVRDRASGRRPRDGRSCSRAPGSQGWSARRRWSAARAAGSAGRRRGRPRRRAHAALPPPRRAPRPADTPWRGALEYTVAVSPRCACGSSAPPPHARAARRAPARPRCVSVRVPRGAILTGVGIVPSVRIGVLTGGGDCPGLNAVIRAIVRRGIDDHGHEIVGFRDGWRGPIEGAHEELTIESTRGHPAARRHDPALVAHQPVQARRRPRP